MNVVIRKHLTDKVFCRIKRKYVRPFINILGWDNATRVDKQKEGIIFYFGNNGTKQAFSYNFEDNCKTMNKIIKSLFEYGRGLKC